MYPALTIFLGTLVVFLGCLGVWWVEQRRGQRVGLVRLRRWMDRFLNRTELQLQQVSFWYRQLVVRWGLRYLFHMILRGMLVVLVAVYDKVVALFERNLQVTKQLRKERKRWRRRD